jgi:2'-hydroxyisoflavone reductase
MNRKEFLKGSLWMTVAAACSSLLPSRLWATFVPKRILVLGGTSFLGPAVVDALVADGHTVILFNRGVTNPDLSILAAGSQQPGFIPRQQ